MAHCNHPKYPAWTRLVSLIVERRIHSDTPTAPRKLFRGKLHITKVRFLTMLTREEITEIYEGDPKALISLIQNLEKRIEEQNVKITELEKQVHILKSRCFGYFKE